MKINQILQEAKFAKQKTYYYHGTAGSYLKSIMKHGLIPNKQEGGYGSEEDDNKFGISLTPLSGVYMTSDFRHAKTAAQELSIKTESDPIIFVIKGQSRSNVVDEDFISGTLHEKAKQIIERYFLDNDYELSEEQYEELKSILTEKCFTLLMTKFYGSMENYKKKEMNQELKQRIISVLGEYCEVLIEAHEFQPNDDAVKHVQDKLTKIVRTLNHQLNTSNSVRFEGVIGFSGATKIVGVINLKNLLFWGDSGDVSGRYRVNHPLQILDYQ